ncbi:60 kDa lysophospholipase-like [Diorhabda sublineata]|uniref:60 kDa lysophospholipase-like n=1 Tax=Diorhabda sublineata TaxID=1163346 RepID=UPI0024E12A39|nr:60 kDa lysophospholipase-like [Diorhabda sublineata]
MDFENFRRILVLYVGGTIGMKKNCYDVLEAAHNDFRAKIKSSSSLHDSKWARENLHGKLKENQMILPQSGNGQKILYEIIEYTPLLDSSNMTLKDWIRIAKDIEFYYHDYNGFIVLHGTDTLAYTASALSFMLNGLQKTVIVTGSQIPIFESRSDANNNFFGSLYICGSFTIPEVCVFFSNKLFRGNRVAKVCTEDLYAFDSPNYPALADVGVGIKVHEYFIRKIDYAEKFSVYTDLNPHVAVIEFFPTITAEMLSAFLTIPKLQGVVIQSFGTGNIPSKLDLLEVLGAAVARRVLIVNITICAKGAVSMSYATGKVLQDIGVISGEDLTVEAALAKLCYVLGLPGLTFEERKEAMRTDLRGEMTIQKYEEIK